MAKLASGRLATTHSGVDGKRERDHGEDHRQDPERVGHISVGERPDPARDRQDTGNDRVCPDRASGHGLDGTPGTPLFQVDDRLGGEENRFRFEPDLNEHFRELGGGERGCVSTLSADHVSVSWPLLAAVRVLAVGVAVRRVLADSEQRTRLAVTAGFATAVVRLVGSFFIGLQDLE